MTLIFLWILWGLEDLWIFLSSFYRPMMLPFILGFCFKKSFCVGLSIQDILLRDICLINSLYVVFASTFPWMPVCALPIAVLYFLFLTFRVYNGFLHHLISTIIVADICLMNSSECSFTVCSYYDVVDLKFVYIIQVFLYNVVDRL